MTEENFQLVSREDLIARGSTIGHVDEYADQGVPEGTTPGLTPHEVASLSNEELNRIILAKQHGLIPGIGGSQPQAPRRRMPVTPPPVLPPRSNLPALPSYSGGSELALRGSTDIAEDNEGDVRTDRKSRVLYVGVGAVALVLLTGFGAKAMFGDDAKVAAESMKKPAASARPTAGAETSQEPSASASASESESPSSSPSASQSTTSVLPAVPLDAKFDLPDCSKINVKYVGDSVLPTAWDFMGDKKAGIEPDPNVAPGKLAGKLTLKTCLTTTDAIQKDKKASKRSGQTVFTVDFTQTRTGLDETHLRSGISLNKSISTDEGLLAAIQAVNPDATMDDARVFQAQLAEYQPQVKKLTVLTATQWFKHYYAKPSLEVIQQDILDSLEQQVKDKGYDPASVSFIPDITVNEQFKLSIDKPDPDELTGPFTPRPDLAKFNVIVTNSAGEQLQPEERQ